MAKKNGNGVGWLVAGLAGVFALWQYNKAEEETRKRVSHEATVGERDSIIRIVTYHFGRIADFLGVQAPPLIFDDSASNAESDGTQIRVSVAWVREMLQQHCGTLECSLAFVLAVIAHELAHHAHGDAFVPVHIRNSHGFELRADYFSGLTLAFLGGDPTHVQRIFLVIAPASSLSHPAGEARMRAIQAGYEEGLRRVLAARMPLVRGVLCLGRSSFWHSVETTGSAGVEKSDPVHRFFDRCQDPPAAN